LLDGQVYVDRLGYVRLPDEQLDISLQKIR
jgi:hypothetical protein